VKIEILIALAMLSAGICLPALTQSSEGAPPVSDSRVTYVPPLFADDSVGMDSQQSAMPINTNPLSGALKWTIGSGENTTNIFLPSFQFSEMADTNASNAPAEGQPQAITTVSSGLTLHKSSAAHELSLGYTGGGSFYSVSDNLTSTFQSLSLTEIYTFRRWNLTLKRFPFLCESDWLGDCVGAVLRIHHYSNGPTADICSGAKYPYRACPSDRQYNRGSSRVPFWASRFRNCRRILRPAAFS
jgi:hypothetical protein